ncbi:MAG: hypothetical protein ACNA7J_05900, partial [Wenzhouxiangella sp.]
AACHGPEGRGNPMLGAPDLTAGTYIYGSGLASIQQTIADGRQGVMPAQKQLLGEARTRLVTAYVLSLDGGRNSEDGPDAGYVDVGDHGSDNNHDSAAQASVDESHDD